MQWVLVEVQGKLTLVMVEQIRIIELLAQNHRQKELKIMQKSTKV